MYNSTATSAPARGPRLIPAGGPGRRAHAIAISVSVRTAPAAPQTGVTEVNALTPARTAAQWGHREKARKSSAAARDLERGKQGACKTLEVIFLGGVTSANGCSTVTAVEGFTIDSRAGHRCSEPRCSSESRVTRLAASDTRLPQFGPAICLRVRLGALPSTGKLPYAPNRANGRTRQVLLHKGDQRRRGLHRRARQCRRRLGRRRRRRRLHDFAPGNPQAPQPALGPYRDHLDLPRSA